MSLPNLPGLPDPRRLDDLDRFWDRVAGGGASAAGRTSGAVDAATAAVIRRVHTDLRGTEPDPDFLAHVLEDIMRQTPSHRALPSTPIPAWDVVHPTAISVPGSKPRPDTRRDERRRGWWPQSLDAVAAGLVVLLVAGIVAGNGRIAGLFATQDDGGASGPAATFLGNAARTGEMPGPLPSGEPGLLWRLDAGIGSLSPSASPLVADGTVYLGGWVAPSDSPARPPGFAAIDLATGAMLWHVPLAGLGEPGSPAVAGGVVYVGTTAISDATLRPGTPPAEAGQVNDGFLVALDTRTGDERWRYLSGRSGYLSPVVADGMVYIGSADGTLHAVDAMTGEGRWTFAVPSAGEVLSGSSPTVAGGLVVIGSNLGVLHAVDAATGAERWQATVGGSSPTTAAVADGALYVLTDGKAGSARPGGTFVGAFHEATTTFSLRVLDLATGTERWTADIGPTLAGFQAAPAVVAGTVLVGGVGPYGREVVALDAADGAERWRFAAEDAINASPVVADGVAVVGSFDGNVYAVDLATGTLVWRVETGGGITTTAYIADGAVVVGSGDGNLYAIGGAAPPGTPAATPSVDGDLSGLPDCDIAPLPEVRPNRPTEGSPSTPAADAAVTPAASLVAVSEPQRNGGTPGLAWDDLPTGPAADAATIAGIEATLAGMDACARPGREEQLAAYYTADFLLRPWIRWQLRYNGYFGWSPRSIPEANRGVMETVVLADGRVAVVFRYPGTAVTTEGEFDVEFGWLAVFAEDDGRWLVDELLELSPLGDEGRG